MKFYTMTAKVNELFVTDTYLANSIKGALFQLNNAYNIQSCKLVKVVIHTPKNDTNHTDNLVC